tara:strand:- start:1003 stop:1248 length:246 start_codon:yes stop_codon:yes gene_type:complete
MIIKENNPRQEIISQIDTEKINSFYSVCCTIGGYILFPAKKIDTKLTINCHRGLHPKLIDRWDLSLECIRCFYLLNNTEEI